MIDQPDVRPAPPPVFPMYRALVGIGTACGLFIVTIYQVTKPIIEANKAEALSAAVFDVLPGAESSTTYVYDASADAFRALDEGTRSGLPAVHAGYDDTGKLVGIAIQAEGMGYQDIISVLYGYSFEHEAVIGMRVLESRETPGLGDLIEQDPAFLANFERLDATYDAEAGAIANPIEAVKRGEKTDPWQIDAITGATISSLAIADILRGTTIEWVPRLRAAHDVFLEKAAEARAEAKE